MSAFEPEWATEISEHLAEIIEVRELALPQLASSSGLEIAVCEGILAGQDISTAEADGLERATGMKAYIWLAIQDRARMFRQGSPSSPVVD
jgi:plasmid maintenance system antidote protein VapI